MKWAQQFFKMYQTHFKNDFFEFHFSHFESVHYLQEVDIVSRIYNQILSYKYKKAVIKVWQK